MLVDPENEVEFFYLRPRDIAIYVSSGRLDIGITGRDLLLDSGANAEEILPLGFARSTFRFATKPGTADRPRATSAGMTVATSYEGIVAKHLAEHGVDASVVHLDGAVETAIELGVAEVIADVVETGTSLRNAGLEVFGEPIMKSEAIVIRRVGADAEEPKVQQFLRRLQGVLVARTLRDDGLRLPRRAPGAGRRPHPRPGVADRLAAAQRGLGRRPLDGPVQGGPADHGRPVRHRRARHPDHGHPRLPPLRHGKRPTP